MTQPLEPIAPFSATPPRLLADENYNEHTVRGLLRRRPDMLLITAHDAGLNGIPDPGVLAYAAEHDLILLTHDVQTMPAHFADFLTQLPEGKHCPGVWYTPQSLAIGVAIAAILETWLCSSHDDYLESRAASAVSSGPPVASSHASVYVLCDPYLLYF